MDTYSALQDAEKIMKLMNSAVGVHNLSDSEFLNEVLISIFAAVTQQHLDTITNKVEDISSMSKTKI